MTRNSISTEKSHNDQKEQVYYTYILRCADGSLYTGIAADVDRRMSEHFSKNSRGAKYTKSHEAKKTEAVWKSQSKSFALKLEYRIKRLKKHEKETLIINNDFSVFKDKIHQADYRRL